LLAGTAISDLKLKSPRHISRGAVGTSGQEGNTAAASVSPTEADGDWPQWGRTAGGLRYSPLTQITPENVKHLEVAWVYHTGATIRPSEAGLAHEFNFEATPLKVRDKLFCVRRMQRRLPSNRRPARSSGGSIRARMCKTTSSSAAGCFLL